ncbi:MAG: glutamyl-tRNA reductase [Balneolales bacterium]
MKNNSTFTNDFIAIGINHWKASVPVREKFSLTTEGKRPFLADARTSGLKDVIILSTCNRTEILARCESEEMLIDLLVKHTGGSRREFTDSGFVIKGEAAIRQFFRVSTGLDAQILGDLQIIRQVKEAYELALEMNMVDSLLHRLMQFVFRAHKRSRSETDLANGAATTAYAAVKFARQRLGSLAGKNIVLIGTGKIGKITCKNLLSLGAKEVTLINRNRESAESLGEQYDLPSAGFADISKHIAGADLVIVATGAETPVITKEHVAGLSGSRKKIMLDLSVPRNIDPEVDGLSNIELVNMDMLKDTTDEAYKKRKDNVPLVEAIIEEELTHYKKWLAEQKVVPTIRALNDKVEQIRLTEIARFQKRFDGEDITEIEQLTRRIINKIVAGPIDHLKDNHETTDLSEVINSIFKLNHNGK